MLLDIAIIVFLIIAAIILILVEIFLLPGITMAGVGGFLFAAGGIIFAYTVSTTIGNVTFIAALVGFATAFFFLLRNRSFSKVALNTNVDSHVTSVIDLGVKEGDEGVTTSRLAPIGKAIFHNVQVEAKSEGEFMDENVPVVVVRVEGYNVIVRPKTDNTINN